MSAISSVGTASSAATYQLAQALTTKKPPQAASPKPSTTVASGQDADGDNDGSKSGGLDVFA